MPGMITGAIDVPPHRVAAVDIWFDADGGYVGFDDASPLTTGGGKRLAIEHWNVDRPAMMVGDGSTDLEARPVVDVFVAFAGVVERAGSRVRRHACPSVDPRARTRRARSQSHRANVHRRLER